MLSGFFLLLLQNFWIRIQIKLVLVKWLIYFSSLSVGRFLLPSPFLVCFSFPAVSLLRKTGSLSCGFCTVCVMLIVSRRDHLIWTHRNFLLICLFPSPFWSWLLLHFSTGLVTEDSHHFLRVELGHRNILPSPLWWSPVIRILFWRPWSTQIILSVS